MENLITFLFPVVTGIIGLYLVLGVIYRHQGLKGVIIWSLGLVSIILIFWKIGWFQMEPGKNPQSHFLFR